MGGSLKAFSIFGRWSLCRHPVIALLTSNRLVNKLQIWRFVLLSRITSPKLYCSVMFYSKTGANVNWISGQFKRINWNHITNITGTVYHSIGMFGANKYCVKRNIERQQKSMQWPWHADLYMPACLTNASISFHSNAEQCRTATARIFMHIISQNCR